MKKVFLILSTLLFGISIINAQTSEPETIFGGVLNKKAISLPAPVFPAAAKAVGACGAVSVRVLVNEQGNTVSAETASGHPLLRRSAEKAALKSKFKPTLFSGKPVKVTGLISYVFVCPNEENAPPESPENNGSPLTYAGNAGETLARRITDDKPINGGVVNGKALSLPAPKYPAAAGAVRAGGLVKVQILIDEKGNVMSATAVSGHPLLRIASEKAALESRFRPTSLAGNPVKVSGIISYVYNVPMSFIEVGYELARVEKSAASSSDFPAFRIENYLPKDWTEERADIKKLDYYFEAKDLPPYEPETEKPGEENKTIDYASKNDSTKPPRTDVLARVGSAAGVRRAPSPPLVDIKTFDPVEFISSLQPKIQNRLTGDEKNLWYFNLGVILGKISAETEDFALMQQNAADLRRLTGDAPAGVSRSVIEQVGSLVELSGQALSAEDKAKLLGIIRGLKNSSDKDL